MDDKIFEFERGAFFGGTLRYEIVKSGNKLIMKGFPCNAFCWMKQSEFVLPEVEVIALTDKLEQVKNWKEHYKCESDILDGYGWSISYQYGNSKIYSYGYEKYPANYKSVVKKLQQVIEDLGKKYDPDYQEDGKDERIRL